MHGLSGAVQIRLLSRAGVNGEGEHATTRDAGDIECEAQISLGVPDPLLTHPSPP